MRDVTISEIEGENTDEMVLKIAKLIGIEITHHEST